MTILANILEHKREEVRALKQIGINYVGKRSPQDISLHKNFLESNQLSVIAEIKRASPSKGDINVGMEPIEQANLYELGGASAISVLTDGPFFKGSMEDLTNVCESVSLPILNKDFIIDEIQIDRAYHAGAHVILLIAAALDFQQLKELYAYARHQGLEVLLEVHNEIELKMAYEVGAKIIGINNRDLKTFKVDLSVTERLAEQVTDPNTVIISESGIKTRNDAERVANAGAHGILVGESLMQSNSVFNTLKDMQIKYY